MDVHIGVTHSPRELELQLPDDADRAAVKSEVEGALAGESTVLWLTDRKGRDVGVPADKIAYVEIGSATEARRMGFSS